ncbi:hypothetical protein OW763_05705 [Clostridium aestuarii]|uniref:Uncharacterized protein n=1 Tax=Clostridium aestuarii TaxID=338193 RepID=A0ABT4CXY0_9CLOT|nr:hypothetical protein [Clostridium aestuarii]MCY6483843.1 hypothetical protein [Clostridium aestuarii]
MEKKDVQEIIHKEIGEPLHELAKSFRKEKKKPNYTIIIVYIILGIYLIYTFYGLTKSIH